MNDDASRPPKKYSVKNATKISRNVLSNTKKILDFSITYKTIYSIKRLLPGNVLPNQALSCLQAFFDFLLLKTSLL